MSLSRTVKGILILILSVYGDSIVKGMVMNSSLYKSIAFYTEILQKSSQTKLLPGY